MRIAPHYLRFVRALTFVSLALPVPVVVIATNSTACGGQVDEPGPAYGNALPPETGGGGIQPGPFMGTQPAPGVAPCPTGCGVTIPPDSGDSDATIDASNDDGGDVVDGGDGGGPSRGTPELPASWLA